MSPRQSQHVASASYLSAAAASTAAAAVPASYWEQRARRYAREGEGLAAVCSYGMPRFYNRQIQLCQRLALAPWLAVPQGTRVLDVGCGVGRWSRHLARRGATVTGVDLSPTMVAVARHRAHIAGLSTQCRFLVQDVAQLPAVGSFDLVLAVTVLQHIVDGARLRSAIERMALHLAPGGRMVLLEAAPLRTSERCNSATFQARDRHTYLELFGQCGLRVRALSGVDPAPFKTWLLPHLRRLPRPLRLAALSGSCALSLPIDLLFGRSAVARSWHTVFVLERIEETRGGG